MLLRGSLVRLIQPSKVSLALLLSCFCPATRPNDLVRLQDIIRQRWREVKKSALIDMWVPHTPAILSGCKTSVEDWVA